MTGAPHAIASAIGKPEAFVERWEHEELRRLVEANEVLVGHEARKPNLPTNSEAPQLRIDDGTFTGQNAADDDELMARPQRSRQPGVGLEQPVDVLPRLDPAGVEHVAALEPRQSSAQRLQRPQSGSSGT